MLDRRTFLASVAALAASPLPGTEVVGADKGPFVMHNFAPGCTVMEWHDDGRRVLWTWRGGDWKVEEVE